MSIRLTQTMHCHTPQTPVTHVHRRHQSQTTRRRLIFIMLMHGFVEGVVVVSSRQPKFRPLNIESSAPSSILLRLLFHVKHTRDARSHTRRARQTCARCLHTAIHTHLFIRVALHRTRVNSDAPSTRADVKITLAALLPRPRVHRFTKKHPVTTIHIHTQPHSTRRVTRVTRTAKKLTTHKRRLLRRTKAAAQRMLPTVNAQPHGALVLHDLHADARRRRQARRALSFATSKINQLHARSCCAPGPATSNTHTHANTHLRMRGANHRVLSRPIWQHVV